MLGKVCNDTTMTELPARRRLRVLAIHRYYWPDTPPYASMLRSIVGRWAADGHDVQVFSTQPSYKPAAAIPPQASLERLDDVLVRRVTLPAEQGKPVTRALNILRFAFGILRHALREKRFDVVMASTAPPVLIAAAARWAARLSGAKFIYHCMDIHPEIGQISGDFANPAVFSILQHIDANNCRQASRVIVLSRDMEEAIRRRKACRAARIEVINNFNLPIFGEQQRRGPSREMEKSKGVFRVLFAGNVGRFQGLETVVDAMHELVTHDGIELLLVGDGKAVSELKTRAGSLLGNRIRFFPHQPVDVAKAIIGTSDLCLVSLTPGIYRYAFPSKTMTCLGEGRPLLACVERESELADFVTRQGVGVTATAGDTKAVAGAIRALADAPDRWREMAIRAKCASEEFFSEKAVLDRWSRLLLSVAAEG